MSMHEVEDLVEDPARVLLASSRASRRKVRGDLQACRFQRWFDTGDTTGGLQEELEAWVTSISSFTRPFHFCAVR
jgi:hypothetical protein